MQPCKISRNKFLKIVNKEICLEKCKWLMALIWQKFNHLHSYVDHMLTLCVIYQLVCRTRVDIPLFRGTNKAVNDR